MARATNDTLILPEVLIARRKSKAWTQEELARRAGLSVRTIKKAEAGEPTGLLTLRCIAEALGVEPVAMAQGLHPNTTEQPAADAPRGQSLLGKWQDTYRYLDLPADRDEHRETIIVEAHKGIELRGTIFEDDFPDRVWHFQGRFDHEILILMYYPATETLWKGHGAYVLQLMADGSFEGRSLGHDFHTSGRGTLARHRMTSMSR